MLNAKKIDFKTIALIVVSTLLVASLSLAGTMAWFSATDSATNNTLTMGDPIDLFIEEGDAGADSFDIDVASDQLLPGMEIAPDLAVTFAASTTASLLRVTMGMSADIGTSGLDQTTVDALAADLLTALEGKLTDGWYADSGYFYYVGVSGDGSYVMTADADGVATGFAGTGGKVGSTDAEYVAATDRTVAATTELAASVIPGGSTHTVTFFDPSSQSIRIPTSWEDNLSGVVLTLTFTAEAVQDYLVIGDAVVAPTIANAATVFTDAGF